MQQPKKPSSFEFHVNVSHHRMYFLLNSHLHVTADETCSSPHNHQECELRYFEAGVVDYNVGKTIYHCKPGDYLLIPPGFYHSQMSYASDLRECSQYNLRFAVELRGKKSEDSEKLVKQMHTSLSIPRFVQQDTQRLEQLLHLISYEFSAQLPGQITSLKALCAALAVELLRPLYSSVPEIFPKEKDAYSGDVRTAIDNFFRHKYLTDVTINDLAADMQISVRQASRIFQKVYGTTFSRKLREMRLEAAKVLLVNSDQSIASVAANCGFDTYSYFYTSFINHVGISPHIYRQQHQNEVQ